MLETFTDQLILLDTMDRKCEQNFKNDSCTVSHPLKRSQLTENVHNLKLKMSDV